MIFRVTNVSPRRGLEENAVDREYPVSLAIVLRDVEGVSLGSGVRTARIEGRGLSLRRFDNLAV